MSETGGSFWDGAASVLNGLANALRSTADDMAKTNAEFASSSGLTAKIERSTSGESCSWCSSIAGTYAYGSEPKDVYRRHDNCDCTVEYVTSKGSQNVHSKQWTKSTDKDTIKNRENPGRRTDISFDNDKFVIAEAKLTEYLPKPGGKHAAEFFDVGYSKEDKQVLLSDIYEQFDIESKSDVRELSDGSIRFSIEMQLGVTQKKPFVTGWIIDGSRAKPRFITAYRISKKMKLFDHVKIKSSGRTGTIIDVRGESAKMYMVEDDEESSASGLDRWPIYDCLEQDLEITDR